MVSQNLAELARRSSDFESGCQYLLEAAGYFCAPEAREYLPRFIAHANAFSDYFENKTILDQLAVLLNERLDETVLKQILEQARELYGRMR